MIDLAYMKRYALSAYSWGQRFVVVAFLIPNYEIFRKVRIVVEGRENLIRGENVIYAMNHTDRFNYWPFQYFLWRKGYEETTVWVKGKYYRHPLLAAALGLANCIPVPSMGYFIEEFYLKRNEKRINPDDYRIIKDAVDGKKDAALDAAREMLGIGGVDFLRTYHELILAEVARLTRSALFEKHLSLIIFPEGTRSLELREGLTGVAQVALHTQKTLIPVACNNSEEIYPGANPVAKSGTIIYRVGKPLSVKDELAPYCIKEPFSLLSSVSRKEYNDNFSGATKLIMEKINAMLDEKYRGPIHGGE